MDEIPPALNDEANYGIVADKIAKKTGDHPAYVLRRLDQYEALLGMDVSPENLSAVYQYYRQRELAIEVQSQEHS